MRIPPSTKVVSRVGGAFVAVGGLFTFTDITDAAGNTLSAMADNWVGTAIVLVGIVVLAYGSSDSWLAAIGVVSRRGMARKVKDWLHDRSWTVKVERLAPDFVYAVSDGSLSFHVLLAEKPEPALQLPGDKLTSSIDYYKATAAEWRRLGIDLTRIATGAPRLRSEVHGLGGWEFHARYVISVPLAGLTEHSFFDAAETLGRTVAEAEMLIEDLRATVEERKLKIGLGEDP